MKYTIPIELVVDGERVAQEQAAMEPMATAHQDEPERKNPIRLLGLRSSNSRTVRLHRKLTQSKREQISRRG